MCESLRRRDPAMQSLSSLAVHHQCFKDHTATEFAIEKFRHFHPDTPYYLWSDAGADFSGVAKEYNAVYNYSRVNVGHSLYSVPQLKELLERIRVTAQSSQAKLILWMEDDVLVRGKIRLEPEVEAGCLPYTGNLLWQPCVDLIRFKYKLEPKQEWFGMAGGALINGNLFRNRWELIEEFASVDYPELLETCGPQVGYGDVILQMIHLIADIPCKQGGYVIDVNERIMPKIPLLRRSKKWWIRPSALVHGYKKHYTK